MKFPLHALWISCLYVVCTICVYVAGSAFRFSGFLVTGGVAAAGKLIWRPVLAETTGAATDGDTSEILAIEETVGKQWFCRYKAALFLAHKGSKVKLKQKLP